MSEWYDNATHYLCELKRNDENKIILKDNQEKKIMPCIMWFLKSSFLIKAQWFWTGFQ